MPAKSAVTRRAPQAASLCSRSTGLLRRRPQHSRLLRLRQTGRPGFPMVGGHIRAASAPQAAPSPLSAQSLFFHGGRHVAAALRRLPLHSPSRCSGSLRCGAPAPQQARAHLCAARRGPATLRCAVIRFAHCPSVQPWPSAACPPGNALRAGRLRLLGLAAQNTPPASWCGAQHRGGCAPPHPSGSVPLH